MCCGLCIARLLLCNPSVYSISAKIVKNTEDVQPTDCHLTLMKNVHHNLLRVPLTLLMFICPTLLGRWLRKEIRSAIQVKDEDVETELKEYQEVTKEQEKLLAWERRLEVLRNKERLKQKRASNENKALMAKKVKKAEKDKIKKKAKITLPEKFVRL